MGDLALMPRESQFHVILTLHERRALESLAQKYKSSYCDVIRAKIILLAAEGLSNDLIAARLDTPRQIVSKWRKRFCLARLPGLENEPRGGRKARFPPQSRRPSKSTRLS
jgi:Homeodomain-like domain